MNSAIIFHPTRLSSNSRTVEELDTFFHWCRELAELSGKPVSVLIQHNLAKDRLAISVERVGSRTLADHSAKARDVIRSMRNKVFKEIEREEARASGEEKKRSARKKNR